MMPGNRRDHGGGLDAALAQYGGKRSNWLDLSTGINPNPYTTPALEPSSWRNLPDYEANAALCTAARKFWNVPDSADILAVPGCSSAIAQIPSLQPASLVEIATRTYNEHAAAFLFHGWDTHARLTTPQARVVVHPNNPTGEFHSKITAAPLTVIDESFCDVTPEKIYIAKTVLPGHIILKSFGKFWGLAGLRLGFAIGDPALIDPLRQKLGPWPVSGLALQVGTQALGDHAWAVETRQRLTEDAIYLDETMAKIGATPMGDCPLFRTYEVKSANELHRQMAQSHIWSRIFPYSKKWIRLGLPPKSDWGRLQDAL